MGVKAEELRHLVEPAKQKLNSHRPVMWLVHVEIFVATMAGYGL